MRIWALVLIAGCAYTPPGATVDGGDGSDGGDAPGPTTFAKRITITSGSATALADFPVSIVLAAAADLAAHARDDGRDLAFTLPDGTRLDTELIRFDGASGALEAWVRIPMLEPTTEIELRYGGDPLDATPRPWSSLFAAVWHLEASDDLMIDSTGAHDLSAPEATALAAPTLGIAGSGRRFDGADDTASAGDPEDGSLDFGTGSFSLSAWVDVTASANAFDMVITKGRGESAGAGYSISLGTVNWLVEASDGAIAPDARFGGELDLLGDWHHLVGVVDRETTTLFAYLDGELVGQGDISTLGSVDTPDGFAIGSPDPGFVFRGDVDEVRIYRGALAADWIAAEHRNLDAPASFVEVGPEETR